MIMKKNAKFIKKILIILFSHNTIKYLYKKIKIKKYLKKIKIKIKI